MKTQRGKDGTAPRKRTQVSAAIIIFSFSLFLFFPRCRRWFFPLRLMISIYNYYDNCGDGNMLRTFNEYRALLADPHSGGQAYPCGTGLPATAPFALRVIYRFLDFFPSSSLSFSITSLCLSRLSLFLFLCGLLGWPSGRATTAFLNTPAVREAMHMKPESFYGYRWFQMSHVLRPVS